MSTKLLISTKVNASGVTTAISAGHQPRIGTEPWAVRCSTKSGRARTIQLRTTMLTTATTRMPNLLMKLSTMSSQWRALLGEKKNDRKDQVEGKGVAVGVDRGGRRMLHKKK